MSIIATPKIIAHRGASARAPENTLAAFQLAWECAADGIEGDFRLTIDDRIVCLHDATTKRTGNRELTADQATLEALRTIDVGTWKGERWAGEHIATLEEIVAILPDDKLFFLEVKCGPEIVAPLKKIVGQFRRLEQQMSVISFSSDVIRAMRAELPQIQANWLSEFRYDEADARWGPTGEEVAAVLKDLGTDGVGLQANLAAIDEAFVEPLHRAKFALHVWTVDDRDSALRFAELGFQTITTNRPDEMKRFFAAAP